MTKEEKGKIIDELSQKFANNQFFYITDASGMTVAQVNAFRRACFENKIEYLVVKNTLIAKALETLDTNTDFSEFNKKVLKGFSGIIFSPESGKVPAKVLKDFRKKIDSQKPVLKGASIDYDLFIGEENLDTLLTLKSKHELIGEIIGLLQSPAKNVISALQGGGNKLAGILKTLSEREEK
jgi:large subunit ribosomal protein L10